MSINVDFLNLIRYFFMNINANFYYLVIQNRALRLIGEYDKYTMIKKLPSDNKIPTLGKYFKVLALKLYASDRSSGYRYIKN